MVLPFRRMCGVVTLLAALLVRLRGPVLPCLTLASDRRLCCNRCSSDRLRTGRLKLVASHHERGDRRRQAAPLVALLLPPPGRRSDGYQRALALIQSRARLPWGPGAQARVRAVLL